MTANELKYTYMEEAMSILDNEELMRKALSLLRNLKRRPSRLPSEASGRCWKRLSRA